MKFHSGWLLLLLIIPENVLAIAPPDLVVSIGAQIANISSLLLLVAGTAVGAVLIFFKNGLMYLRSNKGLYCTTCILFLILLMSALFHFVSPYVWTPEAVSDEQFNYQFFNDSVLLFGESEAGPTIISIDTNRRAIDPQQYLHYYFINGIYKENSTQTYLEAVHDTQTLQDVPGQFSLNRIRAADQSTRSSYIGDLAVVGTQLTFETAEMVGDFISKDHKNYTRYHSVGSVTVESEGVKQNMHAFVEAMYGFDYRDQIFFAGRENIEATTYQFILWDEADNFYLIDDTDVLSDTDAYVDHTWILYKSVTGFSKKTFSASVELEQNTAIINIPELQNATLDMHLAESIKTNIPNRELWYVEGTVSDEIDQRTISGVLHIQR